MRRFLAAFAIAVLAAAPALAQDDAAKTALELTDGGAVLTLEPLTCTPEQNCPDLQLVCTNGSIELRIRNLGVTHQERWMAAGETATLWVDDAQMNFALQYFTPIEADRYLARLDPTGGDQTLMLATLATAAELAVIVPFFTFVVDFSAADADNQAGFVAACGGPAAN